MMMMMMGTGEMAQGTKFLLCKNGDLIESSSAVKS